MNAKHAAAFEEHLIKVFEIYDRNPPSDSVLRLWWSVLERYPWPIVEQTLLDHVSGCKFAPKPADIIERMIGNDGRPTPDEAWSTAINADDEAETVVWTAETAAAFGVARPVLDAGDKIGARKTFIAAYERACAAARFRMEPVRWSTSLGHDPGLRLTAIEEAVRCGRLPQARARHLLPNISGSQSDSLTLAPVNPANVLLASNVHKLPNEQQRNAARFLAIVKAAQAHANATEQAAQAKAAAEREEHRREERLKAKQALVELERRQQSNPADRDCRSRQAGGA